MQALALVPNKASLYIRRTVLANEKKWITFHAHSGRGSELAVSISKTVTTMLRHFDQDERKSDGSRHWELIKSVLVRKFAYEGARDFSDERGYKRSLKVAQRTELSTVKKGGVLCSLRAIQGDCGGISTSLNFMMGCVSIPRNWERYIFHRGHS